jgi:hypothetical protein
VLARVPGAYPAHQPVPRVVVDRVEYRLGHSVPEVVRPPSVLRGSAPAAEVESSRLRTARVARSPPARPCPTGRTTARTTRSNPHAPSSSTPRHPGRTAPAAETNPRPPRWPGPHPEPSSTSPRTATSPEKPASLIPRSRAELRKQLPATSTRSGPSSSSAAARASASWPLVRSRPRLPPATGIRGHRLLKLTECAWHHSCGEITRRRCRRYPHLLTRRPGRVGPACGLAVEDCRDLRLAADALGAEGG